MKSYTIANALSEICKTMPFVSENITSIMYWGCKKDMFIIEINFNKMVFINLNDNTYKTIIKSI